MKLLWISCVSLLLSASSSLSLPNGHGSIIPKTVVIDGVRLVENKLRLWAGDASRKAALGHLTTEADSWLSQGPWTVTSKSQAPPNGTIHDYASQAPYWWPSNTTDGCPYVNRDGERNPEVEKYTDHSGRRSMFRSSYILSLAWYYTGQAKYAKRASLILQTWFIDPATAMMPHLQHAQIIPCRNDGRAIGIIDFSQEYTNVLDAAAILASTNAPGWTRANQHAFMNWNRQFLDWLVNSPFGKEEAGEENNHGTFAKMQIAALALFTGDRSLAEKTSEEAKSLINVQIRPNGSQPAELERTRSWHYSNFNLGAHLRFALVSKKVGVDLLGYKGPDGQSLFGAANFLLKAAVEGQSAWEFEELEFKPYAATDNIHAAADAGDREAKAVVPRLPPPPTGDIYVLRPAAEQLDNIAG
ncbi:hypothetical protein CNMCM5793_007777 [Aspergillus hiratsukae]|uniref:Alginate lyase domain-containing protein n=1 Tax=Aspergillus hiratsukae TaxID=1194566 RepID=A0A8H6P1K4_9EURO|nr:hypothetical protein CNMCM5793_007777 [Aspergillus hiratsukae]KAF7157786.1 hypothetical protein CNMCM6106_003915 [Aspergillus hiratsukae]